MDRKIKFIEVSDPALAVVSGVYPGAFTAIREVSFGEVPIGAFDRFTEEFSSHMRLTFPAIIVGDDLKVYHQMMSDKEVAVLIRRIELWCMGRDAMEQIDPPLI